MKDKLEDARISLRKEREEVQNEFKQEEKEGRMSEDEHRKGKEDLQKFVDEANAKFDVLAKKKEEEISS